MANPRFYLYPSDDGPLRTIDLGEALSDLQCTPIGEVDDADFGDLTPARQWHGARYRVRIILERFGTTTGQDSIERELNAMWTHLARGGYVGFAADAGKAWCAKGRGTPTQGDTYLRSYGNGFTAWEAAATLASADEVCIESANPESHREFRRISGLGDADTQVNFDSETLFFTYSMASTVLVRHRDFFPVLYMPKSETGKPVVTTDHRINWTLDVTLEYALGAACALFDAGGDTAYERGTPTVGSLALRSTTSSVLQGGSLEQVLSGVTSSLPGGNTRRGAQVGPSVLTGVGASSDHRWRP